MLIFWFGRLLAVGALIFCWREKSWHQVLFWICLNAAGVLNGAVLLANNGRMPVTQPHYEIKVYDTMHMEATSSSRLLWLADVHGPRWARYSIGDGFIALGLLGLCTKRFWRKK